MCKFIKNLFKKPAPREKYALFCGLNNYSQPGNELQGCINDNLKPALYYDFWFKPENIRILTDDQATTQNVVDNLKWLVSHENSELVYQNSSHGTYLPDQNGDEIDGYDEALVTYDGLLIDDVLGDIFDTIPESSFLTFICDSCHSGTPSRSIQKGQVRFLNPSVPAKGQPKIIKKIGSRAAFNHVVISACQDNQTAADAYIEGMWQGAFTYTLKQHLSPDKTWAQIYPDILNTLKTNGFTQTPCLNGREIETRLIFGGI